MWHLQNDSDEILEVIETVDMSVTGCRISDKYSPSISLLESDGSLCFTGYEPGTSYVIRPQKEPNHYRSYDKWSHSERMKSTQKPINPESGNESKREANSGVGGKSNND